MLNLTRLQHAMALGREHNFARAAATLGLTQPALTRSIQTLERELGVKLFDRQARGTVPTAFGDLVLKHAEELLTREQDLRRDLQKMTTLEVGDLRVGAGPYPARTILGPTLAQLCGNESHFRIAVTIDHVQRLRELLLAGEIDLFIGDSSANRDDVLDIIPLKERPTVLYCRTGHPLAHARELRAGDVLRFPLGFPNPRPEQQEAARQILHEEETTKQRMTLLADDISLLSSVVRNSDCVGFATPEAIIDEVRFGQVVILPYHLPPVFGSKLGIAKVKGATLSPLASVFITAVQQHDASEFILEHSAIFAADDKLAAAS
ncbi:MAG TPA: LysR family transcriptional regulator [Gammaproteobacteria bacterium]|nr:LysR family transcriptional regulator [Gammaproteobacteria bacterium]